jgi:peptide chain release factor subunit 1
MPLTDQLDRLAAFERAPYPVVSLYLNTQPGQTGRDQYQTFVRKELAARVRTYAENSPERASLNRDIEKILRYLDNDVDPSANGVAIFACSAGELFEAIQLGAAIDQHWLYIGDQPHLYPLARLESQYPRYAAVLADTNSARILVFASGELVTAREVTGVKTRRTSQGGWSQARFQRHISNFHMQHAKEVVDALERVVQQEGITQILLAGDEVIMPQLRGQMPKHLAEKVVDQLRVDTHAPLDEILEASLESMRRLDQQTDREKVEAAVGGYRAGALGVVGPEDTLDALVKGQVEELLIAANVRELQGVAAGGARSEAAATDTGIMEAAVETAAAGEAAQADPSDVRFADELITKAKQTAARITFIENPDLLADYGGVAALLRFRI